MALYPGMRPLRLLLLAWVSCVALVGCSKRSNTLDISPPLPPAEEPSDDVPGAYLGDAGPSQP